MSKRSDADAVSREPGFWANFREPSKLAKAIEMPLVNPNWQKSVLNAYSQTKFLPTPKETP